jgi:hypothetical protein
LDVSESIFTFEKNDDEASLFNQTRQSKKGNCGLFGWGGFGFMDLDLRVQIQILCLDDLKPLGFGFGPNPSRILKAQIHGFQMTS